MTRSSFTGILLAGALVAGCSKPNPLFIDTWDVVTDSGSVSEASGTSLTSETTTTGPIDPPTSTSTTTSVSGSDVGSSEVTVTSSSTTTTTETTGDPFFCALEGDNCCDVWIPAAADTFFVDAGDGVGPGCPLGAAPMGYSNVPCRFWNFDKVEQLPIFLDMTGLEPLYIKGEGLFALALAMENGELVHAESKLTIGWELVQSLALELPVTAKWDLYTAPKFALYGLPEAALWQEGAGEPGPCAFGGSSHECRACMPDQPVLSCAESWAMPGDFESLGDVMGGPGVDAGVLEIPLDKDKFMATSSRGLLLQPLSAFHGDMEKPEVPFDAFVLKTLESGAPPKVRARLCMK